MGQEIVKITDYDQILDLLIQQYKDKPKFVAILEAMNDQADDLESALFEIRDNYWLSTAEGDQLDVIGEIQGESRQGRNDTDYRTAIESRIILNNGSGEFETIITAFTDLFGATAVQLQNQGNAILYAWTDITITEYQFNTIVAFLAAGVELYVITGSTNPFVFYDDPDGTGFGKLSDNDQQLIDTDDDSIQDTDGDDIMVLVNEADPDEGGEIQGVWMTT